MASAMSLSTARSSTWRCAQSTTARRACIGVSRVALKDHAAWGTGWAPTRILPSSILISRARWTDGDGDRRKRDRSAVRGTDFHVPEPLALAAGAAARECQKLAVARLAGDVRRVRQARGD